MLLCICILFPCFAGCDRDKQKNVCAFLVNVENNTLTLDLAEYITSEDTQRINELGLTQQDLINGYYIYNPQKIYVTYEFAKKTKFEIIDWHRQFTKEGKNLTYKTKKIQEFYEYLSTYTGGVPGMPLFFDIKDDKITKVVEIIMM